MDRTQDPTDPRPTPWLPAPAGPPPDDSADDDVIPLALADDA